MMSGQLYENISLFQKRALETFRTGKNVLLVAPSSAGKTFIARTYLVEYFQRNFGRFLKSPTKMKVAMLFPYKSIAVQEFGEINEMVSPHGISVLLAVGGMKISEEEIRKANIFIGTYEKFAGLYFRYKKLQKYLKMLIIDEFHFLGTERGIHIEELIMLQKRLNVETQLILLSASLSDPSKIANWLKARLIIEEERPVPLVYDCIKVSNIAKKLNEETIGEKQVLVFLNSRSKTEKLAEQIATQRKKSVIVNNLNDFLKQVIESATEQEIQEVMQQSYFPQKLRKCINYGVAYHHAGLSDIVRMLIEQLYAQGILDVIVTTSTLAAGVNLPADKVFYVIDYYPRFKTFSDPNQVFQALGRAGRLGLKNIGKGVLIANSQRTLDKAKRKLFEYVNNKYLPKFEPIESYFGHYEQLISYYLKLIVFEEEPLMLDENVLLDYLKSSFWFQSNIEHLSEYSITPLFSSLISTEGTQKIITFYKEYEDLLKISSNEVLEIKEIRISLSNQIQALLQEGSRLFRVYVSPSVRRCTCQRQHSNYLCRHQRFLFRKYPKIQPYLNRYGIIDFLIQEGFVVLSRNKTLVPTKLGQLTAKFFINPILTIQLLEFTARTSIFSIEKYLNELVLKDPYFKQLKRSNELSYFQMIQLLLDITKKTKPIPKICEKFNISDSLIEELKEILTNRFMLVMSLFRFQGKKSIIQQINATKILEEMKND